MLLLRREADIRLSGLASRNQTEQNNHINLSNVLLVTGNCCTVGPTCAELMLLKIDGLPR